ncbi:hypothetical protein [Aureibacter tunicatorum]|uniref:NTP pyrophosphatase (Non-canonical NTP hydrolase) n=1 Tax=Aureibacter tunicatorum TaxID=866807 RepID=A0AAE3XLS3_9BACT|nr:hypothetical protein [Aureibacter tunicatorum]MDR6238835.1 NTP pyrophosphatase (non-canonical NTP hydrolase) [Aureibacter tunicatorum]BDD05238.1 hypothetical protein AUTU_27210 [Aureibacter tunicatorum]
MINKLSKEIHQNNKEKGFYENERNIGELLCLIHSEVSEALEAHRIEKHTHEMPSAISQGIQAPNLTKEDASLFKKEFEAKIKNSFEDELADTMIRIMDLAAYLNIDLETHILAKIQYNKLREHKHGKKY